ncbi:hypothetical protein [Mycobacterium terramassiliense]|uniref:Mycobacterium terramassiliense ORFan n=1 Tax=Mycobacterium terramassiliense TaxID=1841859 RepID=A0A2U3NID4_9MYCO|nr:hypothetical protein [Mycobacterium terramassiliense]SPM31297.1 Mycobacterium terramassiliense ORFan [Mycobacterium terramassiliense]
MIGRDHEIGETTRAIADDAARGVALAGKAGNSYPHNSSADGPAGGGTGGGGVLAEAGLPGGSGGNGGV